MSFVQKRNLYKEDKVKGRCPMTKNQSFCNSPFCKFIRLLYYGSCPIFSVSGFSSFVKQNIIAPRIAGIVYSNVKSF